MDIIIYGAGNLGNRLYRRVKKYKNINVVGFADTYKKGFVEDIPIVDVLVEKEKYRNYPIVIAGGFVARKEIWEKLNIEGFTHIYCWLMKEYNYKNDFLEGECVSFIPMTENSLFYAEMSVIDYCNLNCKGCTHYSAIFEKSLPDMDARLYDIEYLTKIYDHIAEFGLIGGEPLLHPEIERFVTKVRRIIPTTQIQMVTNGLLLLKIEDKVLECLHDNNITVAISEYIPTLKIIGKIRKRLEKYKIDYVLKSSDSKSKFYKTLSLKKNSIYPHKCISRGCVNLVDGKIARCPTLLYVEALNKRFSTFFPTDGIYKIKDYVEGKQLNLDLEKRVSLCDYCVDYQFDWEPCGKEIRLEDFIVME